MIEILFENRDVAVCVKPVGVPSQNDRSEDVVKLLSEQTESEIFPVHRLDTAVGGTMVFAKSSRAAAALSAQIADRSFKKKYLAVLTAAPENDSGVLEDLLFKDSAKNKTYVVKRERRGVKKASLSYETLAKNEGKALVDVLLHTGRSHQIRVQFASRKRPLVGDGKYGGGDNACTVALWSHTVEFSLGGERMSFSSLPDTTAYPWNKFPAGVYTK